VIAQGVSAGRSGLVQGAIARVVTPITSGPTLEDQPHAQNARHSLLTCGLFSDAMTTLIEVQERLERAAPSLVRHYTAQKIGQLIWRLDEAPALSDAPFEAQQLKAAEDALAQNAIDVTV